MLPAYNKSYSVYSINARRWLSILCGFHRCKVERAYWTRQTEVWREFSSDRHRQRQKPLWKKPHGGKKACKKKPQSPKTNKPVQHQHQPHHVETLAAIQFHNKDQMRGVRKDSRSNWAKPTLKAAFFPPEENFLPCQVVACLRMHLPRENRGRRRQKSGRKPKNHENGRNQN